jgi:hypothetical protein
MAGKREKEDATTKPLVANIVATGSTEFTGDELLICLSRRIDAVRLRRARMTHTPPKYARLFGIIWNQASTCPDLGAMVILPLLLSH